jgi:hypothetical protein
VKLSVLVVKVLETALVSEVLNLLVRCDEDLSISYCEVEGKIALGVQVIVLDTSGKEAVGLLLNLVQVGKLQFTNCKASGHAELPLDLICKKNTVSYKECFLRHQYLPGT